MLVAGVGLSGWAGWVADGSGVCGGEAGGVEMVSYFVSIFPSVFQLSTVEIGRVWISLDTQNDLCFNVHPFRRTVFPYFGCSPIKMNTYDSRSIRKLISISISRCF